MADRTLFFIRRLIKAKVLPIFYLSLRRTISPMIVSKSNSSAISRWIRQIQEYYFQEIVIVENLFHYTMLQLRNDQQNILGSINTPSHLSSQPSSFIFSASSGKSVGRNRQILAALSQRKQCYCLSQGSKLGHFVCLSTMNDELASLIYSHFYKVPFQQRNSVNCQMYRQQPRFQPEDVHICQVESTFANQHHLFQSYSSGLLLSSRFIITSRHSVKQQSYELVQCEVFVNKKKTPYVYGHSVKYVAYNSDNDIAILMLSSQVEFIQIGINYIGTISQEQFKRAKIVEQQGGDECERFKHSDSSYIVTYESLLPYYSVRQVELGQIKQNEVYFHLRHMSTLLRGSSGGALLMQIQGRYRLIGILRGCEDDLYRGVLFTEQILKWIESRMKKMNEWEGKGQEGVDLMEEEIDIEVSEEEIQSIEQQCIMDEEMMEPLQREVLID